MAANRPTVNIIQAPNKSNDIIIFEFPTIDKKRMAKLIKNDFPIGPSKLPAGWNSVRYTKNKDKTTVRIVSSKKQSQKISKRLRRSINREYKLLEKSGELAPKVPKKAEQKRKREFERTMTRRPAWMVDIPGIE